MTDDEIRALFEAATAGPWLVPEPTDPMTCVYTEATNIALLLRRSDAQFIAAAHTLVPELLERAQRAEAERDSERAACVAWLESHAENYKSNIEVRNQLRDKAHQLRTGQHRS